jgi:hypothetical protein
MQHEVSMKRKEWTNETPHFTSTKTRKKKKKTEPHICTQTQKRTPEKREKKKTPR